MENLIMDVNNEEITKILDSCFDYGYIDKDGIIVREYSDEQDGLVYKNVEAFKEKKGICYINTDGVEYTYNDFLNECEGNEKIAVSCFSMMVITWNYPDSYVDDGLEEEYFTQCNCMYLYDHNKLSECPKCHASYVEED